MIFRRMLNLSAPVELSINLLGWSPFRSEGCRIVGRVAVGFWSKSSEISTWYSSSLQMRIHILPLKQFSSGWSCEDPTGSPSIIIRSWWRNETCDYKDINDGNEINKQKSNVPIDTHFWTLNHDVFKLFFCECKVLPEELDPIFYSFDRSWQPERLHRDNSSDTLNVQSPTASYLWI